MSQHIQQVIGLQAGQMMQGQLVQGQLVSGGQVTQGQMVMTSAANLTALPQQQIVTQLVSGQSVQGTITSNSIGNTTLASGQDLQQLVASSAASGLHHVISGQQVMSAQTLQQVVSQHQQQQAQQSQVVVSANSQQVKQTTPTQAVPPPSPSVSLSENPLPVITKQRMSELVKEVDPNEQLDEEVEELLMTIADDFIESTVNAACRLAKHRGSRSLDVKDVQMYLERNWHMWLPGFGTEELRPYKRAPTTEAHKQRLALLRKAVKKY